MTGLSSETNNTFLRAYFAYRLIERLEHQHAVPPMLNSSTTVSVRFVCEICCDTNASVCAVTVMCVNERQTAVQNTTSLLHAACTVTRLIIIKLIFYHYQGRAWHESGGGEGRGL